MSEIDNIIDFAEHIVKEDKDFMDRIESWEAYITPIFKEFSGYEYRLEYESMYSLENQEFIKKHKKLILKHK